MYTLDTNAIIYYLKGEEDVMAFLDDVAVRQTPIYVASLTEVELFSFSKLTENEEKDIDAFLRSILVISLDSQIARIAGLLGRKYTLKLADSIIAATALFTGSVLVTRNVRDFKRVPQLTVEQI